MVGATGLLGATWLALAFLGDGSTLRVGSAAVDLSGDDAMVIAGGIGPGVAKGQEGRLRAVATVIEGPATAGGPSIRRSSQQEPADKAARSRVALIVCDVLMMEREFLDAAARRIESDLAIPFEGILIAATHTHHAPSTVTIHGYGRDEAFCCRVRDAVVEAARLAVRRLEDGAPCSLSFRLGEESSVGQNSRLLLSDGTIYWVGPREDAVRPTGPFDAELPVLAFRREGGGLEAVIFNHSTHSIGSLEPGKRSPSFYGLAAQGLEEELGCRVAFVPGAFGSTHNLTLGAPEMAHRIREAVREALAAGTPRPVSPFRALKREFPYRVRKFDEAREEEAVSAYVRKRAPGGADYTIGVFRKMRAELGPHQGEERKTWIQALCIGDVAWVAAPGELFTKLGVEIKRRSPFRYTYVAGVANDWIGYIPDARAFDLGGYQVWTGFHSLVEKGTGEAFVDAAIRLLEEIHDEPR